ncbi:hypothetical protein BAL199_11896 [alpha proteobacterium BAL199]|nr:hypothetical protein BAL199_11896 [alpha proteobacterium BAL199]
MSGLARARSVYDFNLRAVPQLLVAGGGNHRIGGQAAAHFDESWEALAYRYRSPNGLAAVDAVHEQLACILKQR